MSRHFSIGKDIPIPKGRRWVISDIHGCIHTFKTLLSRINLQPEDQLFLLGDYINKGHSSLEVVLEIIEMKSNVYPLLGNHDKMLLDYYLNPTQELESTLHRLNSSALVDLNDTEKENIARFLQELPYFYISGKYILVHAGFNFQDKNAFKDTISMITIKDFTYDSNIASDKAIIHGHNPKPLQMIRENIKLNKKILPIDNGCVYTGIMEDVGNLIGLEINQMEILIQQNVD